MDLERETKYNNTYHELINRVVADLFSFDDIPQKRILDHYYFHDAVFDSPLLVTSGVYNIRHIFLLWKALNKTPPTVDNVCFNGQTCVTYLTQHVCPRAFPFVKLDVPVIVTLHFQETDVDSGLLKISSHKESWTLEGILQAVPLISLWYEHVVRVMMGRLLTSTGEVIHSAAETAHHLLSCQNSPLVHQTSLAPCHGLVIQHQHAKHPNKMDNPHDHHD